MRAPRLEDFLRDLEAGGAYALEGLGGPLTPRVAALGAAVELLANTGEWSPDRAPRTIKSGRTLRPTGRYDRKAADLRRRLRRAGAKPQDADDGVAARFADIEVEFDASPFLDGWDISPVQFATLGAERHAIATLGERRHGSVAIETTGSDGAVRSNLFRILDGEACIGRLRFAFDTLGDVLANEPGGAQWRLEARSETRNGLAHLVVIEIGGRAMPARARTLCDQIELLLALAKPLRCLGHDHVLLGKNVESCSSATLMAARAGAIDAAVARVDAMVAEVAR